MNIELLRSRLASAGYRMYPSGKDDAELWCKTVPDVPPCQTNDKLQLCVTVFAFAEHPLPQVEVGITAEMGRLWFKLRVYSVGVEELCEDQQLLRRIERILLATWDTVVRESS